MPVWQPGFLDIHHLQVGTSVCTLVVFPDGTTMLIDAGDKNYTALTIEKQKIIQPPHPDDSKAVAEWILDYIKHQSVAETGKYELDYVLITHFHQDHMGTIAEGVWPASKSGKFHKTGITWIAEDQDISIKTLIDRNHPDYNIPIQSLRDYGKDMANYLEFVDEYKNEGKIHFEAFQVGSYNQIRPLYSMPRSEPCDNGLVSIPELPGFPKKDSRCVHFVVRNIKANLNFSPALPDNQHIFAIPDVELIVDPKTGKWNENKLATAIVIEYGNFAYYGGADQEHRDHEGSIHIDTVTPVAMAAGKVDIATLNHHGWGTNDAYFRYLDPTVLILPGWHVRHPPKLMSPLLKRHRHGRHWFSTYTHPDNEPFRDGDVVWDASEGHIVVRVYPPPVKEEDRSSLHQQYQIYVLDGQRHVQSVHGPFVVTNKEDRN